MRTVRTALAVTIEQGASHAYYLLSFKKVGGKPCCSHPIDAETKVNKY